MQEIALPHMQFLAARSLCTNFLELKYSIPCATSKHILIRMSRLVSWTITRRYTSVVYWVWESSLARKPHTVHLQTPVDGSHHWSGTAQYRKFPKILPPPNFLHTTEKCLLKYSICLVHNPTALTIFMHEVDSCMGTFWKNGSFAQRVLWEISDALLILSREASKQLALSWWQGTTSCKLTFPVQVAKALALTSECVYKHNQQWS